MTSVVPLNLQEDREKQVDGALARAFTLIEQGSPRLRLEGLPGPAQALFLVRLWKQHRRPMALVVADQLSAESLLGDLRYFIRHENLKLQARLFPTWELLPYEPLSPLSETSGERLELLHRLEEGHCPLLLIPVEAALQYLMPRSVLRNMTYTFKTGDTVDRELLEICLVDNGYERTSLVEARGQFSIRGDILDVFLPSHAYPVRLEFFGDEVESIRHFDVTSQISVEEIERVDILPVHEICLTQKQAEEGMERLVAYAQQQTIKRHRLDEVMEKLRCLKSFSGIEWLMPFFYGQRETVLDYLDPKALVLIHEPEKVEEKARDYQGLVLEEYDRSLSRNDVAAPPDAVFMEPDTWFQALKARGAVSLNSLKVSDPNEAEAVPFALKTLPLQYAHFDAFAATAADWERQGLTVTVVAPTKGHVHRINELLLEKPLNVRVEQGQLSHGFLWPEVQSVFVGEHEIFGRSHKHRQRRRTRNYRFQRGFQDLQPGDLLVHADYGIGKYVRTKELTTGVGSGEFLEILYAEDQKLYIPMDALGALQKYTGSGDTNPPLSKLGGVAWKREKKKIKESIRKMAQELVKIYAARQMAEGHSFTPDPVMMQEFSDSFEYVETDDQLKAIDDVLEDLEKGKPMDRLICGDVGYGKTEVAMRAAFKVLLDKRQVAVLVPTTILAQQHLNTFRERFRNWPIAVDMVSRFRSAAEQKETLKKLKEGKLDVVIGTHRLLSKDVKFSDLGLIIVDEEQRFGVKHKDHLKKLRASVNILTLTATPIPRTLHFSMMGIRDLSVIETPPSDRLAIKTYIRKFDEGVIRDAIRRELDRGGQIYFVHNQIQGIHRIAKLIQDIIPEVRIGIAHGQLQERMLEATMRQFLDKEIDLLLSTSIVESGLDIPTANTIIINRADRFGLAQLYQLRGRVGRYKHQAFAYLLIPGTQNITEDARKRLFAIEEMSELGTGFQLATRDLEIRGTGNMLGKHQSGHIAAIGFDLYCKMMDETIREMKGERVESKIETELDLQVRGFMPKDYIPELNQRLEAYRRLQLVGNLDDVTDLRKELEDRYGKCPEPVEKLLVLMEIKLLCRRIHISKARLVRGQVTFHIEPDTPLDTRKLMQLLNPDLKLMTEFQLVLRLKQGGWRDDTTSIRECLDSLVQTLPDDAS